MLCLQERRAEAAIGRMCTPKARSGNVTAPQTLRVEFAAGGTRRMALVRQFLAAAGDKDTNYESRAEACLQPLDPSSQTPLAGCLRSPSGAHAHQEPQAQDQENLWLVHQGEDEDCS